MSPAVRKYFSPRPKQKWTVNRRRRRSLAGLTRYLITSEGQYVLTDTGLKIELT